MSVEEKTKRIKELAGARGFDESGRFFAPEIEQTDALPVPRRMLRAADIKPSVASPSEIIAELQAYGVVPDLRYLIDNAMEYVTRMTNRSGPAFWSEVDRILERDGYLQQARRVQERYGTMLAIGGNVQREVVWVTDGGEGLCDQCAKMAGTIAPYRQLAAQGMLPGASVCDGGDRCRCELLPID